MNSQYLFNEPTVEQVGSHMIQSTPYRPTKTKYCNIDTRFREDYDSSKTANYIISLPQRITKVKSMKVTNLEIPYSYYNVSSSLNNSSILFTTNTGVQTLYTIANGFYCANASTNNSNTIVSYFGANAINSYMTYSQYNTNFSQFVFTPSGAVTSMTMQFSIDSSGNFDKLELKNKVGWLLGYRSASYTFTATNTTIRSEAMVDMNGFRYIFLILDEFTQNTNDNAFVSPLYRSIISKNIIARMNSIFPLTTYKFGDGIISTNVKDGTLVTDKRNYNNVDLQKLRVELVNEFGNVINLNGLDFSFCLEIEYE